MCHLAPANLLQWAYNAAQWPTGSRIFHHLGPSWFKLVFVMSYGSIILLKVVPCPLPSGFKRIPTIEVWIHPHSSFHVFICMCVCVCGHYEFQMKQTLWATYHNVWHEAGTHLPSLWDDWGDRRMGRGYKGTKLATPKCVSSCWELI